MVALFTMQCGNRGLPAASALFREAGADLIDRRLIRPFDDPIVSPPPAVRSLAIRQPESNPEHSGQRHG